jgi:hypothetical protein
VLLNAFPNPFIDEAVLVFNLPEDMEITLRLYQTNGQLVSRILSERRPAGRNVVRFNGSRLPSGVYLLKLTHAGGDQILRMVKN